MEEAVPHSDVSMEGGVLDSDVNKNDAQVVDGTQLEWVKTSETAVKHGTDGSTAPFIGQRMDDAKERIKIDDITAVDNSDELTKKSDDFGNSAVSSSITTVVTIVKDINTEIDVMSDVIQDEKCGKHPGKLLEYVCNDHGEVICMRCRDKHHSKCQSNGYIEELQNIYKMECNDYLEKGKKHLNEIEEMLAEKHTGFDNTKFSIQVCKTNILELHKKFRDSIQFSEDQLMKRLSEIGSNLERDHLTDVETLDGTKKELNDLMSKINASKRQSTASSVAAAFEGRRLIKKHKESLMDLKNKGSVCVLFEEDTSVGPFLKSFKGAGNITEQISTENIYDNDGKSDGVQRLDNFTLKKTSKSCNILVMPDNRILVSDETNGLIYCFAADGCLLFDTNNIKSPLGLCHMMWNFVVVVNNEGMIPMEVQDRGFATKDKLSGDSFCAISFHSGYFVLCAEHTVHVKNVLGHTIREIPDGREYFCKPIFSQPKAISFDDESCSKFYVTDGRQRKVFCMTIDGKRLWSYSVKDSSPGEITCRRYIFVLCRDKSRILQLEKSGNLLTSYDTEYGNPSGMFVDHNMTMYLLETKESTSTKIIKMDIKEWCH